MDDELVADDILWMMDLSDGISHVGLNSGRGEIGTTSYFDDLRVYTLAINDEIADR